MAVLCLYLAPHLPIQGVCVGDRGGDLCGSVGICICGLCEDVTVDLILSIAAEGGVGGVIRECGQEMRDVITIACLNKLESVTITFP